jgi:hypothetical protein
MRSFFLMVLSILVVGCNKSGSKEEKPSAVGIKKEAKPPLSVITSAGQNDRNDIQLKRRLWTIRWDKAHLTVVNNHQEGKMWDVNGDVYDRDDQDVNAGPVSTFQAKVGEADQKENRLILSEGVKVVSKTKATVLTAKKVEWIADLKVFKASGDVIVEGANGVVGPTQELFVSSKLDKIATAASYFKK